MLLLWLQAYTAAGSRCSRPIDTDPNAGQEEARRGRQPRRRDT